MHVSPILWICAGCLLFLAACAGSGAPSAIHLDEQAELGRLLFFDPSLSEPAGQSCATCHAPERHFTDPRGTLTSQGVLPGLFGSRNAPSAAYAAFSPAFHYDEAGGTYQGGQFLDGRASTLEDQAQGPPLNPIEMHNPDRAAYVAKVALAPYASRLRQVHGQDLFLDPERAFQVIAQSIATFERTALFSPFSSKYDAHLKGGAVLTQQERRGLELFEGRAGCSACHPNRSEDPRTPPLFTDFTYDNLGVPRNPDNPFYTLAPALNPDGAAFVDIGLAGNAQVIRDGRSLESRGKFKVPSLRNLAETPPYMHNGSLPTLLDVVRFYNRRDLEPLRFDPPEVPDNVNRRELGSLGLSGEEEDALVAFLNTLTDGYRP